METNYTVNKDGNVRNKPRNVREHLHISYLYMCIYIHVYIHICNLYACIHIYIYTYIVAWVTMFLFHFFGGRDGLRLVGVVAGLGQGLQIAFPLCGESLLHQHRVVQGARCPKTLGGRDRNLDHKFDMFCVLKTHGGLGGRF